MSCGVNSVSVPAKLNGESKQQDEPAASYTTEVTQIDMLDLRSINVIGMFKSKTKNIALIRLSNGKRVSVKVGDKLDGGKVVRIFDKGLHYIKRGQLITLDYSSGVNWRLNLGKENADEICKNLISHSSSLEKALGGLSTSIIPKENQLMFGDLYSLVNSYEAEALKRKVECIPHSVDTSFGSVTRPKVRPVNLTVTIQNELNRIGCIVGKADGLIGPKTRSGLFRFSEKASIEFNTQLINDPNFLKLLKSFPSNTCSKIEKRKAPVNANSSTSKTNTTSSIASSTELQALRLERQQIEANLQSIEQMYAQQKRAANSQYKMCLSNCMMNNKAGKGFAAALSGMGQCNSSCAPLKYGGAVVPPSWERNQRRLKTIDCTITQMSRNQATARCNEF